MYFYIFWTLAVILLFYFRCLEAPSSLKMMASGVASNSQSIGSGTLTAAPIMSKIITTKVYNMCQKCQQLYNLTHNPSK